MAQSGASRRSRASARWRFRSSGAASSGHALSERFRRRVGVAGSSSRSTSVRNGEGCSGFPSSLEACRTRCRRFHGRVQAVAKRWRSMLCGIGALEADLAGGLGAQQAPVVAGAGQAPLLEAEHEGGLEAAGAGAAQAEDRHAAGLGVVADPHGDARDEIDERAALEVVQPQRADLVDRAQHRAAAAHRHAPVRGHEPRAQRVCGAHHLPGKERRTGQRIGLGDEPVDGGAERLAHELRHGGARLVVAEHAAAAQPALGEVDPAPGDARERASQVGEELGPLAAHPAEPQRAEQGDAKAGLGERHAGVHRERDAKRRKRVLQRQPVIRSARARSRRSRRG